MGFNNDTPDTRDNYTPAFNSSVKAKTQQQEDFFSKHLKQYSDFISWARWYPDLFLDLIRPRDPITKEPVGGIQLHFDQRVFLRSIMRFQSISMIIIVLIRRRLMKILIINLEKHMV